MPTDADSTASALLFLTALASRDVSVDGHAVERAVERLALHQDRDCGGVATYREPRPIRSFMGLDSRFDIHGWCSSHVEVTAAAGRAFAAVRGTAAGGEADAAWSYVRARQQADGSWASYWWATHHYPTLQAVMLARELGDHAAVSRAATWALREQRDDGGWGAPDSASSAFETALSLSVLLRAGESDDGSASERGEDPVERGGSGVKCDETSAEHGGSSLARGGCTAVERAVERLLELQDADGGWPSHPIMRIPPPDLVEPQGRASWRADGLGTGVVVSDQHRTFTTAACVSALALLPSHQRESRALASTTRAVTTTRARTRAVTTTTSVASRAESSPRANAMRGLGSLIREQLADAELLLSEQKRERVWREALIAGRRLLPRVLASTAAGEDPEDFTPAASLGLADPVLPRLLGLGWQQTAGLAAIAGTPVRAREEVARLGGLLNLGVALFDHVCDKIPGGAELLLAQVTPEFLQAQLAKDEFTAASSSGEVGVDLLVGLIADFFDGARRLGGSAADRAAFEGSIHDMYGGERFATRAKREHDPPTPEVWEELRRKSVLPMETMGLLALLAHPNASASQRDGVSSAAALAGEAIWIVDDLADVREDWDSGSWSRPLWLLAQAPKEAPSDGEHAIRRLLELGIAAAEARQLTKRLSGLRELPDASERAFLRPIQAAVFSWLELVPD